MLDIYRMSSRLQSTLSYTAPLKIK